MNITNAIKALRQSRKLQPISVYNPSVHPSIPVRRDLFEKLTPILKLVLKAFNTAGFTHSVSRWGELSFFSPVLGIEILIRFEENTSYMVSISDANIQENGFDLKTVNIPSQPFVLKYLFCGTKSKWRQIAFDLGLNSIDATFVLPILKESQTFQGRLKARIYSNEYNKDISCDSIYAFCRYAANHINNAFGCNQISYIFESMYVRGCHVNTYGALLCTSQWWDLQVIKWSKHDVAFLKNHFPEVLQPYTFRLQTIKRIKPQSDEHELMLETLELALIQKYVDINEAESWLEKKHYFCNKSAPKLCLETIATTKKIVLYVMN